MSDDPTLNAGWDSTHGGPARDQVHVRTKQGKYPAVDGEPSHRGDPALLRDRSFVIERAVEEYNRAAATSPTLSPEDFCQRYREFGSSVQSSICRQIEVDVFAKRHSWLRNLGGEFAWPTTGERLASFEIIEELGRGASSRVYLCRQPDLGGRQVAVKVSRDISFEAHTLGLLRHRNVVPIYAAEHDPTGQRTLICMPFLGRSTLLDLIDLVRDEGLPKTSQTLMRAASIWNQPSDKFAETARPRQLSPTAAYYESVAYIGSSMAAAIAHAHSQGIVHGDVKPSNILLSHDGEPYLMDFNLSGNATLAISARGGTLPYMPPEQLGTVALDDSAATEYDHRSDIFSLGVVLFELLTGRLPFEIERTSSTTSAIAAALLYRQRRGCASLQSLNPNVPKSLAETIEACLAFRPEMRLASATELQERLLAEIQPLRRLRRQAMRRPRTLAAICLVLALVGGGLALRAANASPEHVQLSEDAAALRAAGDFQAAEEKLAQAVAVDPTYDPARREYAKALLASGKTDQARVVLLARAELRHDGHSAATLGYCFSTDQNFTAAIPWYERALELGYDTASVRNNLAVAYESGNSALNDAERLQEAAVHLEEARRKQPTSATVRLNKIIQEIARAQQDGTKVSADCMELCRDLTKEFPQCGALHLYAARAAGLSESAADLDEGIRWLQRAHDLGYQRPVEELKRAADWAPYRKMPQIDSLLLAAAVNPTKRKSEDVIIPRLLPPEL